VSHPDFQKIVVLCLSPLGDTLFATPAIRALGENFPGARILILASIPAAKILQSNPYGMEIIVCHDQWQFLKNLALVRKGKCDLALGLSQLGSLFTRFCGAPRHHDFFDLDDQPSQPVIQLCLEIVRMVGLKANSTQIEFWLNNEAEIKAEKTIARYFDKLNYRGAPFVAVHCGGHYFSRKRWPIDSFIELIHLLQTKLGIQTVLIGGNEDHENSLLIQEEIPDIINLAGLLKLEETAVLLKKCRLLIGNDSGPLHLGVAVGIPTLGLFGPTAPIQFYPYHPPLHTFIYKALPCSPCYKFGGRLWQQIPRCSRAYCMEAISPEEVIQEVGFKLDRFGTNFSSVWKGCLAGENE
jgi:ADP-heptose:LPS heptosyltransferase